MSKHNVFSGYLVAIVILMIAVSTFMTVSYASGILSAAVAFASTDQIGQLQACGVTAPPELLRLQTDIPNFLIPMIYVGFPGLMICIAILMFISGFYYGKEKGLSSSTVITTTSGQNRNDDSGRFEVGTHVEKTRTEKTTKHEGT